MPLPRSRPKARVKWLVEVVEAGRAATRLEAECLSLYVADARRWNTPTRHAINPGQVIVHDGFGVMFLLMYQDDRAVVTTAVLYDAVMRNAKGIQGSKLNTRLKKENMSCL